MPQYSWKKRAIFSIVKSSVVKLKIKHSILISESKVAKTMSVIQYCSVQPLRKITTLLGNLTEVRILNAGSYHW